MFACYPGAFILIYIFAFIYIYAFIRIYAFIIIFAFIRIYIFIRIIIYCFVLVRYAGGGYRFAGGGRRSGGAGGTEAVGVGVCSTAAGVYDLWVPSAYQLQFQNCLCYACATLRLRYASLALRYACATLRLHRQYLIHRCKRRLQRKVTTGYYNIMLQRNVTMQCYNAMCGSIEKEIEKEIEKKSFTDGNFLQVFDIGYYIWYICGKCVQNI